MAETKATTRSLRALRTGPRAALRERARCMLLLLFGHSRCASIPPGHVPHWSPSMVTPKEKSEIAQVAADILYELGYDAAAEELLKDGLSPSAWTYGFPARDALQILEAGPPSVYVDRILVFREPSHRIRDGRGRDWLLAKTPAGTWWRFLLVRDKFWRDAFFSTLREARTVGADYEVPAWVQQRWRR